MLTIRGGLRIHFDKISNQKQREQTIVGVFNFLRGNGITATWSEDMVEIDAATPERKLSEDIAAQIVSSGARFSGVGAKVFNRPPADAKKPVVR